MVFHQGGLSSTWSFIRDVFFNHLLCSFERLWKCRLNLTVAHHLSQQWQSCQSECVFFLQMYTYWTFLVVLLDSLWQSAVIYFLPHLVSTDTCMHAHSHTYTYVNTQTHTYTHTHSLSLSHPLTHINTHTHTHTYITHTFYFCLSFT